MRVHILPYPTSFVFLSLSNFLSGFGSQVRDSAKIEKIFDPDHSCFCRQI